ncbi:MAG TPA: zinc-binding dehydrogenase [Clostridiales bacterium]|nr:zinc-binding dehydrogenase [Clostridiales bacterium]
MSYFINIRRAAAKLRGAGRIIATGTRPDCVALAKEYGATDILSYKDGDLVEQIMGLTGGVGVDACIVAGGGFEALNNAVAVARFGYGNIAMLDVVAGEATVTLNNMYIVGFLAHKTIKGGLCPGGRKRMERLLSMIKYGRIDPAKLITHRFTGLESIEPAFQLMVDKPKDLIKPIVFIE